MLGPKNTSKPVTSMNYIIRISNLMALTFQSREKGDKEVNT